MALQTNRAGELAAQYQAGNRQAMEALLQEIQDGVYYHCVKILRNESDAQDAAQEVLMAVLQGLDDLKNPAAFYSWLNRIIARTCMKVYTREHREIAVNESAEELFSEDLDDQRVPEKILDTEETRRMIRELVDELPPAQRLCVLMYYYDELPVKDIAEALDTPENTVKSRLNYARKAIKAGVERWIAQGLTLYSFAPLPYLRYFLQKESEDSHLPPIIVLRIQEALLAAGAAGAAAAGGGALTGAAAGGAAAGSLIRKGVLLALAGLLAAGGVGGLLLRRPARQPDEVREPDTPRLVETVPAPAETAEEYPSEAEDSSEPEYPSKPELLSDTPSPSTGERTVPVPPPAEETPEEAGGEGTPTSPPQENPESELEPEQESGPEPEPESELEPEPEPAPRPNSRPGSRPEPDPDPEPEPDPDPEPDPEPEPDPDPEPEPEPEPEPLPPDLDLYQPNYAFGNYLGKNEEGIHEFDAFIPANRETQPYPLEDGHYYVQIEISDESRVGAYAQSYIYGIAPGKSEVRYYVSRNPDGPFALAVIAHVTVEPEEPVTPDYEWGVYERTLAGVAYFNHTLVRGGTEDTSPLRPGAFYVKAVSSDPETVEVYGGARLRAVQAGAATVRYYTRWTENDPWVEAAAASVTVLEETPPQPEVAERQTLRVDYGCNANFPDVWQGELPRTLRFTSSNPSVVYVQPEGGGFSALAPGTAELTAFEPLKPETLYVLEVQVDDAFAWEYTVEDMVLSLGERQEQEFKYTVHTSNTTRLSYVSINSADRNIADVFRYQNDMLAEPIRFEILGRSQGTVEITGKIAFEVLTYDGFKRMETTFSFLVQVNDPPEDETPTVRKELEQFGICSGYGYTGFFSSAWDEELPEGLTYLSSDPAVAYINEWGMFSTLSAGTVELTAASETEPVCKYALTLRVEDRFDCARTEKEVMANLEFSNSAQTPNYELPANTRLTNIQWTSSDPEILTVIAGSTGACSFKANRAGKAALNGTATFRVNTAAGTRLMQDTFSLPITVDYYMETEVVEAGQFGFCSGYGYTGSLQDYFPGLPDGLTFHSNDSSIASIHRDGRFTTLKPGRVLLTAYTEFSQSGHQYAVWLDVQDAMDWTYSLEGAELDVGGSVLRGVTDMQMNSGVELRYAYWYAADSRIVSVTKDTDDPLLCRVEAKQPGTTTVNGRLTIQVPFYLFGSVSSTSLSVTVSFPMTVREPAEANPDTPAEANPDAPAEANPDAPAEIPSSNGSGGGGS